MQKYKEDFIKFLLKTNSLRFGEFTLKSGRISPYFFNVGGINNGKDVAKLGYFYASKIKEEAGEDFDVVFGPSYKGIPLALSIVISLAKDFKVNKCYAFDRKEAKSYAEKDVIIGNEIKDGQKIVIVDDVMTTGKTKEDVINLLRNIANVNFKCLIVGLDRQELDEEGNNAVKELENKFGMPILSIVTIREAIEFLYNKKIEGKVWIDDKIKNKLDDYLKKYGTRF